MKKILFCLVCVLACFSMVSAKTQIEYDWGMYNFFTGFNQAGMVNGNFGVIGFEDNSSDYYYELYDKTGERIFYKFFENNNDYVFVNDTLVKFIYDYELNKSYQLVYDQELNFIKKVESLEDSFRYYPITGVTDKYYYIDRSIFDRETYEEIDIEEYIYNHELYDDYLDALEIDDDLLINSVLFNIFKEEFDRTFLLVDSFFSSQYSYNYDMLEFSYDENGNLAIVFSSDNNDQYYISVYNNKYELLYELDVYSANHPYVFLNNNKVYFVEYRNTRERITSNEEFHYDVVLNEFDLEGNFVDEFVLTSIVDKDKNDGFEIREIFNVIETTDGFYLLTDRPHTPPCAMDPTLNDGDVIQEDYPTIQKFSFVYNVETKENDNGSIVVDKESSKSGESVTYTVKPKEGYKLDKVIVTDESGNKVIITDTSFTMPNSNVTVEAIFVVDNPNTSVFLSVAIACILLFVCYFFIVQKNMRFKQFE